jgi:DNA-binding XRE family transcriptional regulator
MGRPTKYNPEMCSLVHKAFICARDGLTDATLAQLLGVTKSTINKWKIDYPEFSDSLKMTKDELDDTVQESLFQRAKGCNHPETKVFYDGKIGEIIEHTVTKHYPPDTGAAFIWLKNRQSQDWADVKENINRYIEDEKVSDLEIARRVAHLLTAAVDPNLLN